MAEATQVIELIKRIIADDTADLRERVQHLESRNGQQLESETVSRPSTSKNQVSMESPTVREAMDSNNELQARLDAIKAIHRLDATPVQYVRNNEGKMVDAPDGLWEISCTACNYQTTFKDGGLQPAPCKTVRLANGDQVT